MNKKILWVVLALIVAVGGLFLYNTYLSPKAQEGSKSVTIEIVIASQNIDKKVEVKTDAAFLYDLLTEQKDALKVEFLDSSFGPMLVGMEGYTAVEANKEFYHLAINGVDAMVGVKEIPVVDGEVYRIELKTW